MSIAAGSTIKDAFAAMQASQLGGSVQSSDYQYVNAVKALLQKELAPYGLSTNDGDIMCVQANNVIVWKQKKPLRRLTPAQAQRYQTYRDVLNDDLKRETLLAAAPEIFQAVIDFIQLADEVECGVMITLKINAL